MRFNLSTFTNEAEMNPRFLQYHDAADAIASVRARIERDFSALAAQQPHLLRLALNEAEALALQTGFPELLFPVLAEEKAGKVAAWNERQKSFQRSRQLHAFAA
jgi:hypothetical protein